MKKMQLKYGTATAKRSGGRLSSPGRMVASLCLATMMLAMVTWLACPGTLQAVSVAIPNASFEAPETPFADPAIASWQDTPKPPWYDEGAYGPWDQLTGVFLNLPPGDERHIDNCDGAQAMFLFALPQVGVFQDYDSTEGTNTVPTHEFNATYEVGKAYSLTVGAIGGLGNMVPGVTLELSLYYRDAASNKVTVAATTITNSPTVFSNATHLIDFALLLPPVEADQPWAGQHIGVQLLSTVPLQSVELHGGYWDLDHVRLSAFNPAVLQAAPAPNGEVQFTLQSEPGLAFELLASTNLAPTGAWSPVDTITNHTGTVSWTDDPGSNNRRYYRARHLP